MSPAAGRSAVLFDPHPLWLDAVAGTLENAGVEIVGKSTSSSGALALVGEHVPDLVVLEAEAPDTGAVELVHQARAAAPGAKIIVLSHRADSEFVSQALVAGAFAFIVKTAPVEDVAFAVRQAFGPSIYLAGSRPSTAAPGTPTAADELTRREIEILRFVAEGRSNADVARALWITEQTVKFHLTNIYRKLRLSNRTEAGRWAQVNGLLA